MGRRPPPIARIRLARSWARTLTLPVLLAVASVVAIVAATLVLEPPLAFVAAAAGAVPGIVGVLLAVRLATMRIEVEEAAVRLRWLGGSRTYALVPGPVTRVRLLGEHASSLRARSGPLGWQVGRARLRGDEDVEVVRLARTRAAILVPTDRGRLAIAAASEPELLDALSRAARARKRLEDLVPQEAEPEASPESAVADGGAPALAIETPAHILTGIERAMLDERLARERVEVEARARAEAEAAARAASETARLEDERRVVDTAQPADATPVAAAAPDRRRPIPSAGLVLVPIIVTVGLWSAALALGRLPEPTTEPGRLTALALVLAGPATSVGAIMARAWWPRLVGVVVTSGVAAATFIASSLFA